ncbi:hypothetical protein [Neobacillus drentensis]|uniref:hypothetical protein n=1 Tax=Neobacillus drentensis TaxID=220684 RepID=UPI002FFF7413
MSKKIGEISGATIGEPIKLIGNKLNSEFISDIGESVKQTSTSSFSSFGQALEGVWNTASGLANKDQQKVQGGLGDLKDFSVRTGKGIAGAVKHTIENGEDVYKGIRDKDRDRLLEGAKGLAKTVAVSSLAIVAVDFLDIGDGVDEVSAESIEGSDVQGDVAVPAGYVEMDVSSENTETDIIHDGMVDLDTRNDSLNGEIHPETGVPFIEEEIQLPSGETIEGVFPDFEESFATSIPDWMYQYSDAQQFQYANMQLSYDVATDQSLADTLDNNAIRIFEAMKNKGINSIG